MDTEFIKWVGISLSFLVTFSLSLFHTSLSSFSKISLSRFLEDKDKEYRLKVLDLYDELKIAVESTRNIFLIAFLVYLYIIFPRLIFWPLWLFLASLVFYLTFFLFLPLLINSLSKETILGFFLPSFKLFHTLSAPFLFLSRTFVQKKEESRETTEEEIETFIDEAKEAGIIEKEEGTLLRSVVEFGDTLVREILTPRVDMICIRRDSTIEKLRELVIKEKVSRIPVYKDRIDNIEGLVIARDLLEYSDETHKDQPIEPLIRSVDFVPESMKVAKLLQEFKKRKQKLAIVVDEHGGVSGLVTMEDLMEEIVGEIQDEYDMEEGQIVENAPFDYTVLGDVEVGKIEDRFDLDLAEDNYITVSGLITHELGRLPKKGEIFQIKGLTLEILDVDQKRIKRLRIKKPKVQNEKEEKGKKTEENKE